LLYKNRSVTNKESGPSFLILGCIAVLFFTAPFSQARAENSLICVPAPREAIPDGKTPGKGNCYPAIRQMRPEMVNGKVTDVARDAVDTTGRATSDPAKPCEPADEDWMELYSPTDSIRYKLFASVPPGYTMRCLAPATRPASAVTQGTGAGAVAADPSPPATNLPADPNFVPVVTAPVQSEDLPPLDAKALAEAQARQVATLAGQSTEGGPNFFQRSYSFFGSVWHSMTDWIFKSSPATTQSPTGVSR
jgi:hypothetical protein